MIIFKRKWLPPVESENWTTNLSYLAHISEKCKIRDALLLLIHTTYHTGFPVAPKLVTLNTLNRAMTIILRYFAELDTYGGQLRLKLDPQAYCLWLNITQLKNLLMATYYGDILINNWDRVR